MIEIPRALRSGDFSSPPSEMTGISSSYSDELRLALGLPSVANLARPPACEQDRTGYRSSKPAPFETCHTWHVSSASPSGVRFPLPHFDTIKPPSGGFCVPIGGDDGNRTRVPQGSPYACTFIADVRLRDPDGNGAKTPYRERVPVPDYR